VDRLCSKCESKARTKADVRPNAAEVMEIDGEMVSLERHQRSRSASCKHANTPIATCTVLTSKHPEAYINVPA